MKSRLALSISLIFLSVILSAQSNFDKKEIAKLFEDTNGTLVIFNCNSDEQFIFNEKFADSSFTPCSTFKIWNTLIGLELSIIHSGDEQFYTWDGKERSIKNWNHDLTLKEAFNVSCVPAYQNMARNIGQQQMQKWIDSIKYGDKDISSGIDDFWLTRENKKSIKISTVKQAMILKKLVNSKLPFSHNSFSTLKEIMLVKDTKLGKLYGKTGSGNNYGDPINKNLGWYVGFIESEGETFSFACLLLGDNVMGKDAKDIVIDIFKRNKLL